jgi:hypothetical protein
MQDNFTITLPSTVSDDEMEALQAALREEESVEDTGSMAARGIDPGSITLWVQVATSVLGHGGADHSESGEDDSRQGHHRRDHQAAERRRDFGGQCLGGRD